MNNTLLAKYIFGETTAAEKAKIEKWLSSSDENRRELEHLRAKIDLSAQRYRPDTFNPQKAFQKWQAQVHPVCSTPKLRPYYYSVAAVLLLFMGCGLFYLIRNQSPESLTIACQSDEIREILLPDHSLVTLAGPASLTYPLRFEGTDREVFLAGKAYFQVHRDTAHAFLVQTPSIQVTVLGTSFQVEADRQQAEVLVHSGKVAVSSPDNSSREILTAGMSSEWSSHSDRLTSDTTFQVNKLSWKTKVLKFKDTPLEEVVQTLNKQYKVKIQLPANYKSFKLTATFNNQSLHEVLGIINQTLNIQLIVPKQ